MPAPKGNNFWEFRTKHGRDKIFSDKNTLREECLKYFQWGKDNPLQEEKVFHSGGEITKTTVSKMRALTLTGLCYYLKISDETWRTYRKDKDLSGVIHEVEQAIYNQKFEGAAAEMLNPNIIARDLGLADKKEIKADVKQNIDGDQLDKRLDSLNEKIKRLEGSET